MGSQLNGILFMIINLLVFQRVISIENDVIQLTSDNMTIVFCSELFSTSLDIECFYEGNSTSCDDPMLDGTVAKLKCKYSYHLDSMPFDEIHCQHGHWNQHLFNCEPVCGIKLSRATPFVIKGKTAIRGDFPWHIELYIKMRTHNKYICGGSILSPKLVITAAHCFLKLEPKLYQVAAGKVHRKWFHKNDDKAQYRDVVNILVEKKYKGGLTGYTADIAILVLNQVFILSDLIQPVCLDYVTTSLEITESNTGIVPGWGLTSEQGSVSDYLQYAILPLRDRDDCLMTVPSDFRAQVTLDKICAGYTNGTSVCTGDSGGGLIIPTEINSTESRYFLIGIVSTGPFKEGSCDAYQYTTFTTIASHIKWINETKFRYETWSPYDYGCFLPDQPFFGNYTVDADISNKEQLIPGSLVPHYTKLKYSCITGYRIHGEEIITCKEKIWNVNSYLPACFRTCPELHSMDLDIEYVFDTVVKSTDNSILPHETRALFRCKNINYELEEFAYNQTTCRDGQWTNPVPKCIPICGVNIKANHHSDYESNAITEEYPWNVAIYKKVNNNFQLECAGSIISLFVIVTESNCVNNITSNQYIVIAGSVKKFAELSTSNRNVQQSNVYKKIEYDNFDTVILKKRFNITSFVRPICLLPIETVFSTSLNRTFEVPFWSQEKDDLKILKFNMIASYSNDITLLNELSITTNYTGFAVGGLTVQRKIRSSTRYCIVGFGKSHQTKNIITNFFEKAGITFITQVVARNDIKYFEINECTVPTQSKHIITIGKNYIPGEIVLEDTIVNYTCKEYYTLYGSNEITCKNNTWLYPRGKPYCIGCGISNLKTNPNRFNSSKFIHKANPKKFPWHAQLYNREKNSTEFVCGGSIISSKIILSNEYCVDEENSTKFTDNFKYYVEVGRYNWNTSLDTHLQQVDVEEIIFYGLYLKVHVGGIYANVIVFVLNKHLIINEHVLPVCLDLKGIMKSFTPPLIGVMPFGSLERNKNDSTRVNFFYISKPLRKFWDILLYFTHEDLNCPNDTHWSTVRGNALTFKMPISKNENRYFLHSMFRYGYCEQNRIIFMDIFRFVKWLESIADFYNY